MHKGRLPAAYVPFAQLDVCGNQFLGGTIALEVAGYVPILIGQPAPPNSEAPPRVWLAVPLGARKWVSVVTDSRVIPGKAGAHFAVVLFQSGSHISIAVRKWTILKARTIEPNRAEVTTLDLRPIGLHIYGDSTNGLQVSNALFRDNCFPNVHTMIRAPL